MRQRDREEKEKSSTEEEDGGRCRETLTKTDRRKVPDNAVGTGGPKENK